MRKVTFRKPNLYDAVHEQKRKKWEHIKKSDFSVAHSTLST